jgi:hypothetical protein
VHLIGFHYKTISWRTVLECQIRQQILISDQLYTLVTVSQEEHILHSMERRMGAPQSQYGHWKSERSLGHVRNEHPIPWSSQTAAYQLHNWAVPEEMGQNEKPTSKNLLISKKGVLIQIMNDKCPITITIKHTIFIRYCEINVSFSIRVVRCFYMQNSLVHTCVHFIGNKIAWTSNLMKMLKQHYGFTDAEPQIFLF